MRIFVFVHCVHKTNPLRFIVRLEESPSLQPRRASALPQDYVGLNVHMNRRGVCLAIYSFLSALSARLLYRCAALLYLRMRDILHGGN